MTPELVREAIRLKLIEPSQAHRYLRESPPAPPLALVSKVPPPKRLIVKTGLHDGRLRRARQRLTRALLAAGVLDRDVIARPSDPRPRPEEDTA